MIQKLINEINTALNNKLYLVALASALTLPDVCGKAEYPNCKTSERYKKWYLNYVKEGDLPSNVVYALRCSLLHEGNTEVESGENIQFTLMTNDFTHSRGVEFCCSANVIHADGSCDKTFQVYVGYLCTVICKAAQEYYQDNKDKFLTLNYNIFELTTQFE